MEIDPMSGKYYKSGFSLVEVMVSMLIVSILTVAGAAFLCQAGGTIAFQKNKRVAIEAASRRLEQLNVEPYLNIRPEGSGRYYINRFNRVVSNNPDETVLINGHRQPILVVAERLNGTKPSCEYVRITVQVQYRAGGNWVMLATNKG